MSTMHISPWIAAAAVFIAAVTPMNGASGEGPGGPPPPVGARALPQEIATAAEFSFGAETAALAFDISGWWKNVTAGGASLYAPLDFDIPESGTFQNMFAHLYDDDPVGSITINLWRKSWDGSTPAELVATVESVGASTDDQTPVTTTFLGLISLNYFYYVEASFSPDAGEKRLYYVGVSYDPTVASAPTGPGESLGSALGRPNPFGAETAIVFDIPVSGDVRVEIFDVTGRRVRTMSVGEMPAGVHTVSWDGQSDAGRRLPNGCYFAHVRTPTEALAVKLIRNR